MLGSKYSAYNYDQIASNPLYEEIGDILVEFADDDSVKEKMQSILKEGGVGEYGISSEQYHMRDNPTIEAERRLEMAYLLAHYPKTFDYFADNNIKFFHGTSGNALPSILKYGLNSVDKSKEMGIEVTTGEEWSRINGGRNFISLTNDLCVAMQYAQMSSGKERTDYGVMIGIREENLRDAKTIRVQSDCPEVGVVGNIPPNAISFVGVPQDKVKFVEKLAQGTGIKVLPMDFETKFYDIVNCPGRISNTLLEEMQARKHGQQTAFHRSGLKALAESVGRGVLNTISNIKEGLKGLNKKGRDEIDER